MSYTAEISRSNPACFLFLIDQSGSMDDPFGASSGRKADHVADAVNKCLQNLVLRCAKPEIRDYFHVGVIGYGETVGSAFSGPHQGKDFVPISEIGQSPASIEERTQKISDGAGGLVDQNIKFPTWFKPIANGPTPMCQALKSAESIIVNWLNNHHDSFPPVIINISDGEPTDGNPSPIAEGIKMLSSSDGNVLLFNLHLSSQKAHPIQFPDSAELLPDTHARLLFDMSSVLPENIMLEAQNDGCNVTEQSKGFVFNSGIDDVIKFLDIGTRAGNLR